MKEKTSILKNINAKDLKEFVNNTSSEYFETTKEKSNIFDLAWVTEFEKTFPYIDNIIRNPRKFIVPEEEITIIEKTKKVNEESIKHLAKHSSMVREIDEDGFVRPSKLLNVYKEETYDLYENRFMFSLIKNLFIFIQRVNEINDYDSFINQKKEAIYEGETYIDDEKIKIKLDIEIKKDINKKLKIEDSKDLNQRIDKLKEVIYGFWSSDFITGLTQAVPVKSPIRKTNVFLREQNFKKALELWEFLEQYQNMDLTSLFESEEKTQSADKKEDFDFIYYLGYNVVNGKKSKFNLENIRDNDDTTYKIVENFVMNSDFTEQSFKKMINNQYRIAVNKKKKTDKEIYDIFKKVIIKFNKRKSKALK